MKYYIIISDHIHGSAPMGVFDSKEKAAIAALVWIKEKNKGIVIKTKSIEDDYENLFRKYEHMKIDQWIFVQDAYCFYNITQNFEWCLQIQEYDLNLIKTE